MTLEELGFKLVGYFAIGDDKLAQYERMDTSTN